MRQCIAKRKGEINISNTYKNKSKNMYTFFLCGILKKQEKGRCTNDNLFIDLIFIFTLLKNLSCETSIENDEGV